MVTYGVLGALLGSFGFGLKLSGWQKTISIAAGAIIVLSVFIRWAKLPLIMGNPFSAFSAKTITTLFQSCSYAALFAIGLFKRLLPCGFVYITLIGLVATQDIVNGTLFMVFFGLSILLMMFSISMVW